MSKLVKLTATGIGDEITLLDLYHTSVEPANLISASFSASLLLASGATFVVEDSVETFYAVCSISGSSCFAETGSVTLGVYNPITRWFYFYTSGSDEGGSISMSYPFSISPTTSSFTASVNFGDYATATLIASGGSGFDDRFEGWYYSPTSSTAFYTGSTLTLTRTTYTGSNKIYAWFKDVLVSNGWAFVAGTYTTGSDTYVGIHKGTLLTSCEYSSSLSESYSSSISESYSASVTQSYSTPFTESTYSSSISCSLISAEEHGSGSSPTTSTTSLPGTNTYFLSSSYYLKGQGIDGIGTANTLSLTRFDSGSDGTVSFGISNASGTGNPGSGSLSGSIYGSNGTSGSWSVIYSASNTYIDQNGSGSSISPESTGLVTMSGITLTDGVTYQIFSG